MRRRRALATPVAALAVIASVGCARTIPPPHTPKDRCHESRTFDVFGSGSMNGSSNVSEFPVIAERGLKLETGPILPRDNPAASYVHDGRVELDRGRRVLSLAGLDVLHAQSVLPDCQFAVGDTVSVDSPLAPLPERSTAGLLYDVRHDTSGGSVAIVGFSTGVHAEQRSRSSPTSGMTVVLRNRDGSGHALLAYHPNEVLWLSSGELVVIQPRMSRVEVTAIDEESGRPGGPTTSIRGSVRVDQDGQISQFRSRGWGSVAWGGNRVWSRRGLRQVVGMDGSGAVFFSRSVGLRIEELLPYRDGICVSSDGGRLRCHDARGRRALDLELPFASAFAVDADGRIYAAGGKRVAAYDPQGNERWQDELSETVSSNLSLSPEFGLCLAIGTAPRRVVCYGTSTLPDRELDPADLAPR